MSHTVKVNSVPIKSINALTCAVNELKQQGVNCDLKTNTQPRMYYKDQHGICDYVLRLHDSPYDVGFDYNKEDNVYNVVVDPWANKVGSQIGASCPIPKTDEEKARHCVGKLMQLYTKHTVIEAATQQGYTVEDAYLDSKNNYQVVVSVC